MTRTASPLSPTHKRIKKELPLGKRIVWARKRQGISQERLAAMIGTSRRHMIRIESGAVKQPGPVFVERIAVAVECPRELFEDDASEEGRSMTLDDFLRSHVRSILAEMA